MSYLCEERAARACSTSRSGQTVLAAAAGVNGCSLDCRVAVAGFGATRASKLIHRPRLLVLEGERRGNSSRTRDEDEKTSTIGFHRVLQVDAHQLSSLNSM